MLHPIGSLYFFILSFHVSCKGVRESILSQMGVAVAAALAVAHGFSVWPLGTRGPIQGRQEVPGRLTSCLWGLSEAREGGTGGLVQPKRRRGLC